MEKFRIGLFGCGNRTREIVKKALESGMACVTRCHDIRQESAAKLAEQYGAKVASLEELLNADDVDMYLISLFPGAHPDNWCHST